MRASRLLSVLLLLQTRGRMTAQELADELEVSVRTIYRDVESLSAAGVPVYADRGPAGGYQLLDGYRTRLTGLTTDEAESLFLTGMPGPAAELGLGAVVAAAELKLQAALPPELRARAGRIRDRFHLDAPTWFRRADDAPYLATLADAVWNQRRVELGYRRWRQPREVTRLVDPLGVVVKAGVWYLVARVGDGDLRTYRVSNVLSVDLLPDHFDRPEDFDLPGYWRIWAEDYERRLLRDEAVIRLSPRGMAWLPLFFGPVMNNAVAEGAGPPDEAGWIQATVPIESVEHAKSDLLRLGPDIEVLAPPELRAELTQITRAMAAVYEPES